MSSNVYNKYIKSKKTKISYILKKSINSRHGFRISQVSRDD